MNQSLQIDFKIAIPWVEVNGIKISGIDLQKYYEKNKLYAYHCRNCGYKLEWTQKYKSHYPCPECKYDGDYKNDKPRADYEI